ncbi:MAG: hypothetical protein ACOCV8_00680, partial [Spirochaetota bacterium]
MNFVKADKNNQKIFLDTLAEELNKKEVLDLYYNLMNRFSEYCYGIKKTNTETDGDSETSPFCSLIYFLPAKKPIVFPPLILPSIVDNINQTLKFTASFIITKIKSLMQSEQILFLLKENTKTGKVLLELNKINNGKIYNNDYDYIIGVIPEKLNQYDKNLLKEAAFKSWNELGDKNVSKLLDFTFENSNDEIIKNGQFKSIMRKDFKNKKISRNDCIIMGNNHKSIGIAFPIKLINESN